jgi:hypothetical protein
MKTMAFLFYFSGMAFNWLIMCARAVKKEVNPMSNLAEATEYISNTKYITVSGYAAPLEPDSAEYQKAVHLISDRSPSFKTRVEKGQLGGNTLFRLYPIR